jgi:hypothetical protein
VQWVDPALTDTLMTPAYPIRVHDAFTPQAATRTHDGEHLLP